MSLRRSRAHTVTRSEYYRGRRTIDPDFKSQWARPARTKRDALEDQPYPRVSLDEAIERAVEFHNTC